MPPPRSRITEMAVRRARLVCGAAFLALASLAAHAQDGLPPSSERSAAVTARLAAILDRRLGPSGLAVGAPVFIRIFKADRTLEVWLADGARYVLVRTFRICAMSGKLGPKLKEGDRQAPEGIYLVRPDQLNPSSRYHLSFDLGFPNAYDRAQGRTGSALMVHGSCVSIGCFAMRNDGIEEIYTLVDAALRSGAPVVPVHVFPFRLEGDWRSAHAGSSHIAFWEMLEPIYAAFEADRRVPEVEVTGGRYRLVGP